MVCLGNHLFHPFHVLGFRLEQAPNIELSRCLDGSRPLAKGTGEATTKIHKPLTDPGQQPDLGLSRRVFLMLPWRPLSCATPQP